MIRGNANPNAISFFIFILLNLEHWFSGIISTLLISLHYRNKFKTLVSLISMIHSWSEIMLIPTLLVSLFLYFFILLNRTFSGIISFDDFIDIMLTLHRAVSSFLHSSPNLCALKEIPKWRRTFWSVSPSNPENLVETWAGISRAAD